MVSYAHQFPTRDPCTSSPAQQLGSCHARSSSECRSFNIPTRLESPGVLPEADLRSETCSNTSPQISPLKGQPKTRGRQYHSPSPLRQSPERMNSTLLLLRRGFIAAPASFDCLDFNTHQKARHQKKFCKILFLHKDHLQQVYYPPSRFDSALAREYLVIDLRHGIFRILAIGHWPIVGRPAPRRRAH
jgi:hypothetical protein